MAAWRAPCLTLFTLFAAAVLAPGLRAGTTQCRVPESTDPGAVDTAAFSVCRIGTPWAQVHWRDLEFSWDQFNDVTITTDVRTTLSNFAHTLIDTTGCNPFAAPYSDIRLIYEYFRDRRYGSAYDPIDAADSSAMYFGTRVGSYWAKDRSHVDVYLAHPDRPGPWGSYPGAFVGQDEDVSTGHPSGEILHQNAVAFRTPTGADRLDLTGRGWTKPDSVWDMNFCHEFRHGLSGTKSGGVYGEMFSAAAEAIGGNRTLETTNEFPYTESLFRYSPLDYHNSNYPGRSLFTAYLAYNFPGLDTTRTIDGMRDDLLHKWAVDSTASLVTLRRLLRDDSCGTCSSKTYFHPGGTAMNDSLRLGLLLHNWRVATYVNNSGLAEGQYGYPPQFGFSPPVQLGTWQSLDGSPSDDVVAVPPEITLSTAQVTRDTTLRDERWLDGGRDTMRLVPYGSEYWVIRSDPAIQGPGKDLLIRVYADSANVTGYSFLCGHPAAGWRDGRLFASAIGYGEESIGGVPEPLWKHPEWATRALAPQWVDVDSTGATAMQIVVPSFGDSVKAAIVVLSLADGPAGYYTFMPVSDTHDRFVSYRLQLALRTAPYPAEDPSPVAQTSGRLEENPSFSPDGQLLVYSKTQSSGQPILYTGTLDGTYFYPSHPSDWPQRRPDWSPRGDWIAYESYEEDWPFSEIHLYNTVTQQERILTPGLEGADEAPAFSPNGQQVAYTVHYAGYLGYADSIWQLRRIDLSGQNDVILVQTGASRPILSPRWSPNGQRIYFAAGDSLYSVSMNDGALLPGGDSLTHVRTFDLHRGRGPIAYEETDSVAYTYLCDSPQDETTRIKRFPYRRIALRDTFQRLPLPQFQQKSVHYFDPRWSYDGTRVAYVSDQNGIGVERDIFLGQVSYNHAPQFVNAPRDTVLPSVCGLSYQRTFTATDPDGEGVWFEAACLPPGAYLLPWSGLFVWPNPGPPGCEYYSVIRALDGSGGVAQKVVKLAVAADPARPAAAQDLELGLGKTSATVTWTDVGDDSLAGTACLVRVRYGTSPITEVNFFASNDTIPDPDAPGEAGSLHCAALTPGALDPCTTYYFGLKTRDDAGNWSALSTVVSGKTRCSGSTEVFCDEGLMAQGGSGEQWLLEGALLGEASAGEAVTDELAMKRRLGSEDGYARVRLSVSGKSAWALDAVGLAAVDHEADEEALLDGDRVLLGTAAAVSRASDGSNDSLAAVLASHEVIRAAAGSAWDVDLGGKDNALAAFVIEVGGGDRCVGAADSGITVLVPDNSGGWKTLATLAPRQQFTSFAVDSVAHGQVRLLFGREYAVRRLGRVDVSDYARPSKLALTSVEPSGADSPAAARDGVAGTATVLGPQESLVLSYAAPSLATGQVRDYLLTVRGGRASASLLANARRQAPEAEPRPASFALHQSEPNPFNRSTRIRFDLPVRSTVRLEVFDAQGRRVATLADGFYAVGYHSCEWSGRRYGGTRVQPGVYVYRIQAGTFRAQRKLVVLP